MIDARAIIKEISFIKIVNWQREHETKLKSPSLSSLGFTLSGAYVLLGCLPDSFFFIKILGEKYESDIIHP